VAIRSRNPDESLDLVVGSPGVGAAKSATDRYYATALDIEVDP
jgi:hypothetical protein